MERQKAAPKPVRYYAPNDRVRLRLEGMGIARSKIYEAKGGETWDKIKMRRGECLGVLDGLRGFGGAVKIKNAVAHFHDQGVTLVDIETGHDSMTHGIPMRDTALEPVRLSVEQIEARRRADAIRRQIENGGMGEREALKYWRDPSLTTEEAVRKIGWTKSMAFKILLARGIPAGRKPLLATE